MHCATAHHFPVLWCEWVARTVTFAPPAPVVQAVPETPVVAETPARAPARAAAPRSTTTTTRQVTRTTAAPAPAPAAAPAAAPVAEAPAPAPAPAVAPPVTGPAATDVSTTTSSETTQTPAEGTATPAPSTPIWPWALLGVLVLAGAIVAMMLRRRPVESAYAEPAYAEPVYAPVAAEPEIVRPAATPRVEPLAAAEAAPFVAADPIVPVTPLVDTPAEHIETEAVVHDAEKSDLEAVMDSDAPVAHRPWLEFGMRPVRAGTTDEEATVEIELTVGNTGDETAKNVRITTFMLADGEGTDMDNLLIEHAGDAAAVPPVSIPAGEGTRVDATLATPKGDLGRTFNPIVVADARYTLPDGSEGRTAAAFKIGRMGVEGLGAIGSSRPHIVENVDAELDQLLERA
jgi:hypothetical protein